MIDAPFIAIYDYHMHRTMIYIQEADIEALQKRAQVSGASLSELIREAIRFYLEKVVRRPSWDSDPAWSLEGMASAKERNKDARDHDRILYGMRRRR